MYAIKFLFMKTIYSESWAVVELNSEEKQVINGGSVLTLAAIFLIGFLIGFGVYEKAN